MSRVIFVQPGGRRQEVAATPGQSVMQAATSNLVAGIIGECGGELVCATCHVFLDAAWSERLPLSSDLEADMLEAASEEPTSTSRLSCQIVVSDELDGLVVHVPVTQR